MRDPVRCPHCPSTVERESYEAHFNRFHRVDLVSGERRNILTDPLPPSVKTRRKSAHRDDPLFGNDLEYDQ